MYRVLRNSTKSFFTLLEIIHREDSQLSSRIVNVLLHLYKDLKKPHIELVHHSLKHKHHFESSENGLLFAHFLGLM